jgi:beta-glucanase (GH16 family)
MQRALWLVVLALYVASASACEASGMRLIWADEFDYQGLPDPQKWTYEVGRIRNHEQQYYTWGREENARVRDGVLTITAVEDDFEGEGITSASITTRETFSFTYGRVAVRAKVPQGRGVWPAAWMLGKNVDTVSWPRCGEIDIMEYVGFEPDTVHFTVHTERYNHTVGTQRIRHLQTPAPYADFHEYAVSWDAEKITFFFDGEPVHEFANDGGGEASWPFDQPMFLILNLAIGGTWGGQKGVDDAIFPAEYQIDYVRVYQES